MVKLISTNATLDGGSPTVQRLIKIAVRTVAVSLLGVSKYFFFFILMSCINAQVDNKKSRPMLGLTATNRTITIQNSCSSLLF